MMIVRRRRKATKSGAWVGFLTDMPESLALGFAAVANVCIRVAMSVARARGAI